MDPFKVRTHPGSPASLEKGCLDAQPLQPEACQDQPARTSGNRSLVKCLGAVGLIWFVFSYGMRAFHGQHLESWRWTGNEVGGLSPPANRDEDRLECVGKTNWTTYHDPPTWTDEYPYGAETSFSLPIDSDALYLISRGLFQHGLVNIEQSTEVVDTADVRVRVAYHNVHLLELATVCPLEGADREYGVGIFTPKRGRYPFSRPHHKPRDQLEFDVTVTLPTGSEGPLLLKKLETRMSDYSQSIAGLQESVLFDEISLSSANGQLTVQSAAFEVGQFSLLNGEIEGYFEARSSLELNTLNGGIAPRVNLVHREGADSPNLTIHTTNGRIDAEVALTSEALIGGEFGVNAESTHGEIGLKFVQTPVESVLRCNAETTVGKIEVELDSAFEGSYSLRNFLGSRLVSQREVEDPAGRGRHRVVTQNAAGGQVAGVVKWVEGDGSVSESEGYVNLKAVTASVALVI